MFVCFVFCNGSDAFILKVQQAEICHVHVATFWLCSRFNQAGRNLAPPAIHRASPAELCALWDCVLYIYYICNCKSRTFSFSNMSKSIITLKCMCQLSTNSLLLLIKHM